MRCISIVRFSYFKIFSASFLITFLSPEIAISINIHVPFSLSRILLLLLLLSSSSSLLLFVTLNSETVSSASFTYLYYLLPHHYPHIFLSFSIIITIFYFTTFYLSVPRSALINFSVTDSTYPSLPLCFSLLVW